MSRSQPGLQFASDVRRCIAISLSSSFSLFVSLFSSPSSWPQSSMGSHLILNFPEFAAVKFPPNFLQHSALARGMERVAEVLDLVRGFCLGSLSLASCGEWRKPKGLRRPLQPVGAACVPHYRPVRAAVCTHYKPVQEAGTCRQYWHATARRPAGKSVPAPGRATPLGRMPASMPTWGSCMARRFVAAGGWCPDHGA